MIYSASSVWAEYKFNDKFHCVLMQSIFFIIGIISVATLFLIILRSIKISVKVPDNFAKFLTFEIIFSNPFKAVVVDFVPVTGVVLLLYLKLHPNFLLKIMGFREFGI